MQKPRFSPQLLLKTDPNSIFSEKALLSGRTFIRPPPGCVRVSLTLETYSGPNKTGKLLSKIFLPFDITVFQLTQFLQASYLATDASSIKEVGGTTQAVTGAITGTSATAGTCGIQFGTGTTAAAYADYAIQTAVSQTGGSTPIAASSSAASSGANTWTITATWNNNTGGSVTVSELAWYCQTSAGVATNKVYCLTHDEFTGTAVSNGGSAAATLTFTMS
jgi:hypothetical protein